MTRHSHAFSRINALIAALSTPRIARTNSLWNYELEGCSLHTLMLCAQPTCQITLFKVRPVKELKSLGEARLTRIQVSIIHKFRFLDGSAPSNVLSAWVGAKKG